MHRKALVILLVLFLLVVFGCESRQERARNELKKLNIKFTADSFVQSAKNSDIVAVENFLDAGMNPDIKNDAGCSAMFYAEIQKNEKMNSLLKEHGAKEVNGDRFIGKWAYYNAYYQLPSTIEISKEGDQYIFWGPPPISYINDNFPLPFIGNPITGFPSNTNWINDNTLAFTVRRSYQPNAVAEAKLGQDDILTVTIEGTSLPFKRISK